MAVAGCDGSVTVTCDDTYAPLTSDTYPDQDMMTGIKGTNEQVPVRDGAEPVAVVENGAALGKASKASVLRRIAWLE